MPAGESTTQRSLSPFSPSVCGRFALDDAAQRADNDRVDPTGAVRRDRDTAHPQVGVRSLRAVLAQPLIDVVHRGTGVTGGTGAVEEEHPRIGGNKIHGTRSFNRGWWG